MFAGTLVSPGVDGKIRRSMRTFKHKKANFKDILRERFQKQIRANRQMLFEKIRGLEDSKEVQNTLSDYLRSEIQEFDIVDQKKRERDQLFSLSKSEMPEMNHDEFLELMKEIESELLNEQYEWILDECRREEEEISFYESTCVICPVCQRGILQKRSLVDSIFCADCDLRLGSSVSLESLSRSLKQNVDEHSRSCGGTPAFGILNDGTANTLFMTCDRCCTLCSLN